ncbi:unnamed protein product, partial [Didymodactylos carnosus]
MLGSMLMYVAFHVNVFSTIIRLLNLCNRFRLFDHCMLHKPTYVESDDEPMNYYCIGVRWFNQINSVSDKEIYEKILLYFTLSYEMLLNDNRIRDSLWPLRGLGYIYYKLDKYLQSYDYFKNALSIMKDDDFNVAACNCCIGLLFDEMKQFDEALKYYKIVLEMEDRTFPIFVAVCCLQIGRVLEKVQQNFCLSREYFERALSLFENKVFPRDCVNLALSSAVI